MNTSKNKTPLSIEIGKEADTGLCKQTRHPYAKHGFLGTKEVQQIRKEKGFKLSFE